MRFSLAFLIFILAANAFSQDSERALTTYSGNDKLVGLSNLVDGFSECPIRSVVGRVRKFKTVGNLVSVRLREAKKKYVDVVVPLGRVDSEDRSYVFRHLITKNNTLRISGYSCSDELPFSAFSVDRVY
ncbi:MAG TPA: hypothetical protein PKD26_05845 [Pyrinomonadaceae bacterium]|nr:hypothetical protein [Pyrinomonadaceae bacterium]